MSPETEKLLRDALLPHEFAEIQSLHQMYRDDLFWLGGTAALVLVSCVERLATALRAAEARAERAEAQVRRWEEREAAVCPEDVSFEEMLKVNAEDAERWRALEQRTTDTLICPPGNHGGPDNTWLVVLDHDVSHKEVFGESLGEAFDRAQEVDRG